MLFLILISQPKIHFKWALYSLFLIYLYSGLLQFLPPALLLQEETEVHFCLFGTWNCSYIKHLIAPVLQRNAMSIYASLYFIQ